MPNDDPNTPSISVQFTGRQSTADAIAARLASAAGSSSAGSDLDAATNEQAAIENTQAASRASSSQQDFRAGFDLFRESYAGNAGQFTGAWQSFQNEMGLVGHVEPALQRRINAYAGGLANAESAQRAATAQAADIAAARSTQNDLGAGFDLFRESYVGTSEGVQDAWAAFQDDLGISGAPSIGLGRRINDYQSGLSAREQTQREASARAAERAARKVTQDDIGAGFDLFAEQYSGTAADVDESFARFQEDLGIQGRLGPNLRQRISSYRQSLRIPVPSASEPTTQGADYSGYNPPPVGSPEADARAAQATADWEAAVSGNDRAARSAEADRMARDDRSPYQRVRQNYADRLEDLQNAYAENGSAWEVFENGPNYSKDVKSLRGEMGLDRTHPYSMQEIMQSRDMAYAIGFGSLTTMRGLERAWQPALAGEQYLPDQVGEQTATSFLPLAFSVGGTAAALAISKNPMVSLGVGMAAGGAGSLAQDSIDTYFRGHTAAQERAGQLLGEGRGGPEAVQEFTDALRNAATPAAKELADTLTKLGDLGPMTPHAASEFGQLQSGMGLAFSRNVEGVGSFLGSSPFLYPEMQKYLSGPTSNVSSQDYAGIAGLAALSGDYQGMRNALATFEVSQRNPQYYADQQAVRAMKSLTTENPSLSDLRTQIQYEFGDDGGANSDRRIADAVKAGQAAEQRLKNESPTIGNVSDIEKRVNGWLYTHMQSEASITSGQDAIMDASSREKLLSIFGGGSAGIGESLPGLQSGAQQEITSLRKDRLDALQGAQESKNNPALAAMFNEIAARDQADINNALLVVPSAQQQQYAAQQDEATAGFQMRTSQNQQELNERVYAGDRWSQMTDVEDRMLSTNRSEANRLRQQELVHFNDLAARRRLESQATDLESENSRIQNTFSWGRVGQQIRQDEIATARSGAAAAREFIQATPDEMYEYNQRTLKSEDREIQDVQKSIDNSKALGLSADQTDSLRSDLYALQMKRAQDARNFELRRVEGNDSIYGSQSAEALINADVATLGRGSASATAEYNRAQVSTLQRFDSDTEASQNTNLDIETRKRYEAEAAQDRKDLMQIDIDRTKYTAPPAMRTEEIQLRGSLERASYSFLEVGNVDAMRGRLFANVARQQRDYEAQIKANFGDHIPEAMKPLIADQEEHFRNEEAQIGYQLDTSFFQKLPELTIGGPSFERRYLPTYAQAAAYTEHVAPGVSAFNFGFFGSNSFNQAAGEVGPLMTAGKTQTDIAPGNLSVQALSTAIAGAVRAGIADGMRGMVINVPPQGRAPAQVQQSNTQSRGLSSGILGAGS